MHKVKNTIHDTGVFLSEMWGYWTGRYSPLLRWVFDEWPVRVRQYESSGLEWSLSWVFLGLLLLKVLGWPWGML